MKDPHDKTVLVPRLTAAIGPAVMALSTLLPYAQARDADEGEAMSHVLGINATSPSMLTFTRSYFHLMDREVVAGQAYLTAVLMGALVVFAAFALLFAALCHPIPALVFDALALGAFLLQNYDFSLRGVVPSDTYAWGAGYYLAFVGAVAGLAGAIWLIVFRHRAKVGKA